MNENSVVVKKNTLSHLALEVLSRSTAYFPSPLAGEGGRSPDEGLSLNNNRFGEDGTQCRVSGKVNKANLMGTPSSALRASSPSRGKWIHGFTLIELLIVIIIIAVLTTVAFPQYKRATMKSRFSKMMPVAKALTEANEVFYLGQNYYVNNDEKDLLDITAQEDITMELSSQEQESKYNYVAASHRDVPGARYIMYQKYSPKFASNIHCEADQTNTDALWLCAKGLQGTELTLEGFSSVQGDNYKTFLLAGDVGAEDFFAKECSGNGEKTCSCGGPVTGSCNEHSGTWEYENDCPEPDPDITEECDTGYTGSRTRQAKCVDGVYVNEWTDTCESSCPSGSTMSYGRCIDTSTWFGNGMIQLREVARAIEDFYQKNGYHATSLAQLGLSNMACSGNYDCHFQSDGTFNVAYKLPGYSWQTHAIFYVPEGITGHQPGNTGSGFYCWGTSSLSSAKAKCQEIGGTLTPGAISVYTTGY